jgi:hypothetical protein
MFAKCHHQMDMNTRDNYHHSSCRWPKLYYRWIEGTGKAAKVTQGEMRATPTCKWGPNSMGNKKDMTMSSSHFYVSPDSEAINIEL